MALWDTADLLRRCKTEGRRPATDQAVPDTMWYDFLTEAQAEVYLDLFSRFPDFGYSTPLLLTSANGGLTYTFGLDAAGDPVSPTGHTEIYPNLSAIPDSPLEAGKDFIFERALIRFPGGRTRTFPNGPYARFIASPDVAIDATHQPQLQPKDARMLLVYKAVQSMAGRPGTGLDPAEFESRYNKFLSKLFLRLSTSYNMQGAQHAGAGDRVWWYSGDLGSRTSLNT